MIELDYHRAGPDAMASIGPINDYLDACELDDTLLELVNLRTSQINGCAYCVDLHSRRLRQLGKEPRYISSVVTWADSPFFDAREKAALGWAEALTRIAEGVPDSIAEAAREEFDDRELVELTLAVGAMNLWNRFSIGFGRQPRVGGG